MALGLARAALAALFSYDARPEPLTYSNTKKRTWPSRLALLLAACADTGFASQGYVGEFEIIVRLGGRRDVGPGSPV